jgi:hypothetical protein
MADPTPQPDQPTVITCPWCSTTVTPGTATCPNCGAVLEGDEEKVLPGVTAVDDKILRGETKPQQRSRLLSWISGDYDEPEGGPVDPAAIAPPDPAVQREMRRLAYEAELANLQAEVEARRIEAVVDELEETGDEAGAEAMVEAVVAEDARIDAEVAALGGKPTTAAETAPEPGAETMPEPPAAADASPDSTATGTSANDTPA